MTFADDLAHLMPHDLREAARHERLERDQHPARFTGPINHVALAERGGIVLTVVKAPLDVGDEDLAVGIREDLVGVDGHTRGSARSVPLDVLDS